MRANVAKTSCEQQARQPDPAADTQARSSPRIPEHYLLVRIDSGAYGEVWLARNAVGTPRAVKLVRRDQHTSVDSFEREFKGLQKFEPISRTRTKVS